MVEVIGGRIVAVHRTARDEESAVTVSGNIDGTSAGAWTSRVWIETAEAGGFAGQSRFACRSTIIPRGDAVKWGPVSRGLWQPPRLFLVETEQGTVTTRNFEDGFTLCRWLEVHASGLWALLTAPERSALAEVVEYGALRDLNLSMAFMRVIDAVREAEVDSTEQYRQLHPWRVVGDPGEQCVYLPDTSGRVMPVDGYVFDLACAYVRSDGPDLLKLGWYLP